jgi:cation transport ATPase
MTISTRGVLPESATRQQIAVLQVGKLRFGTEGAVVESFLGRQPGVIHVEANPSAQTAVVTYDPERTSVADLQRFVQECGYHCAGQSVPLHVCGPMVEPDRPPAEDVMGHGGHAGMSMDTMVRDMRNRFLVAAVFSVPILLWSSIGRDVLHFTVPAPFGLRDDIFQLLLSLPVIFYSASIFFVGAGVTGTVGLIARPEGGQQLTYNTWPLYYFVRDTAPDRTNGQGINAFGGKWLVATPALQP